MGRLTERNRPGFAAAVEKDYGSAPLNERERAMCDYAVKLTLAPWEMNADDLTPLRVVGLSDGDILVVKGREPASQVLSDLHAEADEKGA